MSVEDVISYFYTKKKRYDSKINKKKKNIREDPELSLEEKRIAYKNIKQPCIKCKRNVGTTFTTSNRELVAVCGDTSNPCGLDIKVSMGTHEYIPTLLENIENDINQVKMSISRIKLNLLFDLTNEEEMESSFNQMKELYKKLITSKNVVDETIQKFNTMEVEEVGDVRVIERKKIAESQQLLLNTYIQNFRDLIKDFNEDDLVEERMGKMTDAIDIYMNQILPANKIIRKALYDVVTVLYEKGKYKMIKIPREISKMILEIEKPEVLSNKK